MTTRAHRKGERRTHLQIEGRCRRRGRVRAGGRRDGRREWMDETSGGGTKIESLSAVLGTNLDPRNSVCLGSQREEGTEDLTLR